MAFPALTRHGTISTEWKKQVNDQAFKLTAAEKVGLLIGSVSI